MPEPTSKSGELTLFEAWFRVSFSILLMAFAGVIFRGAILSGATSLRLMMSGATTQGSVVSVLIREHRFSKGTPLRQPVVEFMADNSTVRFRDESGAWRASSDLQGVVPVIYDQDRPEIASINQLWYLWYDPVVRFLISLVFGIPALVLLRSPWRRRRVTP